MQVDYVIVSAPSVRGTPSEDAYTIEGGGGGIPFFLAIADGHGNEVDEEGTLVKKSPTVARFARRVAEGLREQFARFPDPALFTDTFDAVAEQVDAEFLPLTQHLRPPGSLDVGAVAICLTVVDGKIHLAQTGDSRLYAGCTRGSGFTLLTRDHDGRNLGERRRLYPLIEEQRFAILPFSDVLSPVPPRLFRQTERGWYGGLIPTRTFGDWEYQPAVIHTPEVQTVELASVPAGTLFALCSDGGNRTVEEVLGRLRGRTDQGALLEAAELTRARVNGPSDDVTIIYFRAQPSF
ncbi:protein serine/threonine phosphatase 2C family protein [Candidatus Uhrbacteria bacterium]|nr:protein serine/threonine phosphatase 2C family protein [Candidatus Uhrbacteria bacterium]